MIVTASAPCEAAATARGRGTENQRRANLGDGTYRNPVMGGDCPDPTVLRVGDVYYLTFSSFESSPALVLWRSTNLVDWEPVGPACPRPWGSVFATDLVEHEGRFYMYIPFMPTSWSRVDAPTIAVIWTDDIEGEWSEPIDLGIRGYIDPGHAVGEDGERYLFLSGVDRVRLTRDGLATAGPVTHVYDGWRYPEDWVVEAYSLEGPKHLVRDGRHYLVSAVGGTAGPATGHMIIVARSRSIDGPWENMPDNPLLRCTDPAQPWWSRGHGTLVEGPGHLTGDEGAQAGIRLQVIDHCCRGLLLVTEHEDTHTAGGGYRVLGPVDLLLRYGRDLVDGHGGGRVELGLGDTGT